jgi:phytoene dehydrogenase-like protein
MADVNREKLMRRDFLKSVLAGIPAFALDWDSFPRGDAAGVGGESGRGGRTSGSSGGGDSTAATAAGSPDGPWDAVIIGAGLGGLSCAAAFARQGFKPLVLEQHSVPGGYATTFKRPGGYVFDVSLHSTSVGERAGVANLIQGFPEIDDIKFVPHKVLYRAVFPEHDIRVPHRDPDGYFRMLAGLFPEEKEGLEKLYQTMTGLISDLTRYSEAAAGGKINMATVPKDFPSLFQCFSSTWGRVQDSYLKDPKLKGIITALWGYFGLPPSKLASLYYIMPVVGYLRDGGYYPVGKSQAMSDAFVRMIEKRGGKVRLQARVKKILVKDHAAYGVQTEDGTEYTAKAIVSNANAYDTVRTMMDEGEFLKEYLARMDKFTASLSSFQVFLGLKKDLVGKAGIKDTELFWYPDYDHEGGYRACLEGDVEKGGFGVTLYDNLYPGYSPKGKNTVNLMTLQGYEPWKKYETDYFAGKKDAYRAEKKRMADIMIAKAEAAFLPGLRDAIEVIEIGTPLTNVRYTGNYRGAIYGWDQTLDNVEPRRLGHKTPIKNLYLAGAWTRPGGGYGAVIPSGLQCFGEIMEDWKG